MGKSRLDIILDVIDERIIHLSQKLGDEEEIWKTTSNKRKALDRILETEAALRELRSLRKKARKIIVHGS